MCPQNARNVISTTQIINSFKVACLRYAAFIPNSPKIGENLALICSDKKSLKLGMYLVAF